MTGGLGNQLFGYALYLKFILSGTECKIDDFSEYEGHDNRRPLMLEKIGIKYDRATKAEVVAFTDSERDIFHKILRKVRGKRSKEYSEATCNFDPEVLKKDSSYLTGYFQTEKYFKDISDKLRGDINFSLLLNEIEKTDAHTYITQNSDTPITSIHVRRGDYLNTPEIYGGICTDEYYAQAIEYILSKEPESSFLIFSNDHEWAKGFAKESKDKYNRPFIPVTDTTEDDGCIDLYLMSRCRHNIIANSSFSWWGAYLNQNKGKMVIAPGKWANNRDYTDIYTDAMIRL